MRSAVKVIAGKEFRDIYRHQAFVAVLALLCLVSMVAVVLGSAQVRHQVETYRQTVDFLKSLGRTDLPPRPPLNPLAVSKNYVNYLAMLGALLAMILGNYAIRKEVRNGTLRLILARPVFRDQVINGKLLGNVLVLVSLLGGIGAATLVLIRLVGGVALTGPEVFDPGILNPDEAMILQCKLDAPAAPETACRVVVSTPNGISISKSFVTDKH